MFKDLKLETFGAIRGYSEVVDLFKTRYLAEMKTRKRLHDQLVNFKGNIRVFVRIKPLLAIAEDEDGEEKEGVTT